MPLPRRQENRYLTLKWDDIHRSAVTAPEMAVLETIIAKVAGWRGARNKPMRRFICISDKNQSLYEEVWGMKLAEVEKEEEAARESLRQSIANVRTNLRVGRGRGRAVEWNNYLTSSSPEAAPSDDSDQEDEVAASYDPITAPVLTSLTDGTVLGSVRSSSSASDITRHFRMASELTDIEASMNQAWGVDEDSSETS